VSIHDGEHFPQHVRDQIQIPPLGPFVRVGPGFRDTASFTDFQKVVEDLCRLVGNRVKQAPPFQAWPIEEEQQPSPPPPIPQVTF
jgi:hypothetical protein